MGANDGNLAVTVGKVAIRFQPWPFDVEIDLFRYLLERYWGWSQSRWGRRRQRGEESPEVLDEDNPVTLCQDCQILSTRRDMNLKRGCQPNRNIS